MLVKNETGGNPLLGFSKAGKQLSTEETDQVERSEKKVKRKASDFTGDSSMLKSYADIYEHEGDANENNSKQSYKQSLLAEDENLNNHTPNVEMDAEHEEEDEEFAGLTVVEKKVGQYDCPTFILSEREEARIQKPWRQGLIVKLMGRRIGYKALETRLKQIWVRKGVISIIDLGHEYFLVYFTNEEDYTKALEDGPWLIYDHYLIAREWTPNFHPNNATIEKVAVWIRISGLPIEYYDAKILHYIGNRIGKTVKVDRNTLSQERGKYARVYVEVELNKPLLAMFELKNEVYKVEYEGLHMLCRTCGKFGHYVEGCPHKQAPSTNGSDIIRTGRQPAILGGEATTNESDSVGGDGDEPWVIVQKPRRLRKSKDGTSKEGGAAGTGRNNNTGTRFDILETINEDPAIDDTSNEERNTSDPPTHNTPNYVHGKGRGKHVKHMSDKKGKATDNTATHDLTKTTSVMENKSGNQAANITQILKRTNKEVLTTGDNLGSNALSQRQDATNNQHGRSGQAPP
jgi:hypothetical protein